jgi:crotonobetainyl-CoA:carnitine CoA-transferase CaiB-like acyl-CoA transferase
MGVPVRLTETPGRIAGPRATTVLPAQDVIVPQAGGAGATAPASDVEEPPLTGVRILEITNLIAGPTAGRILADLGADVVKLEPPGGDLSRPIARSYFYSVNFNKRSVCVDGQTAAGKRIIQRIAASADALVANLRPDATQRMGLGTAINPRLIETHVTGYGWTGPYARRPGIDPLAQALIGLERAQGGPDNPPVFPAQLAPTDYTAGAICAFGTILALFARACTGIVQRVECDLLSGGIVLSSQWFTRYAGRPERPLADKEQYGLGPFHRLYPLRDGWIYLAADSEEARRAVCAVFDLQSPDAQELRPEGRHPLTTPFASALAQRIAGRATAEVLAALRAGGVPCSEVGPAGPVPFLEHPHAQANAMVAICQHPRAGKLRVAWQLVRFAATRPATGRPTPLLGEHTFEVLREVGFDDEAMRSLLAEGVVRTEAP